MRKNFYDWLKAQTERSPSVKTDQIILAYSNNQLKSESDSYFWKFSGVTVFATLLLFTLFFNKNTSIQSNNPILTESPEMILNYKEIELMAEASNLSDEDWNQINGKN